MCRFLEKPWGISEDLKCHCSRLVSWTFCDWSDNLLLVPRGFYEWICHRQELRHLAHNFNFHFYVLIYDLNLLLMTSAYTAV